MEPLFSFLLVEGRMHDARMLAVSQLYDDLQNFAFDPVGRAMCLYGDPANPLRVHLQAPFRVGILSRDMESPRMLFAHQFNGYSEIL